ncbi:MAG: hypothetical protein ACOVP6_10885 [Lacibacter sp.]|jgi:hypothetical protein
METLKVQIPEGFTFDSFDPKNLEIKIKEKPKDVMERIKTVDDILAAHGLTKAQFDKRCESLSDDEKAYRILKMLAQTLNEGWQPDWNNDSQYKYYAFFYMGGSSGFRCDGYGHWYSFSVVGSRLCFKSSKLAEYAGKQFTEVYKQFMVIN